MVLETLSPTVKVRAARILEDANLEWLGLSFSDEAGREFLDQVGDDLYCSSAFSVFSMYNHYIDARACPNTTKAPLESWDL
jgi:hypothetical protein